MSQNELFELFHYRLSCFVAAPASPPELMAANTVSPAGCGGQASQDYSSLGFICLLPSSFYRAKIMPALREIHNHLKLHHFLTLFPRRKIHSHTKIVSPL
jgi:hypothetical protein